MNAKGMSWTAAAVVLLAAVGLRCSCDSASLPESTTTARTSVAPDSARAEPDEAAADDPARGDSSHDGTDGSVEADRGAAGAGAGDGSTTRVSGVVLDDRGGPVADAKVYAENRESAMSIRSLRRPTAVTRTAGRFEAVTGLKPPLVLVAEADGFEPGATKLVGDGAVVEIRLRRLLRILGRVVDDATGKPIEHWTARLCPDGASGEPVTSGLGFVSERYELIRAILGLEGLALTDLAPGRYALMVSVPGYECWRGDGIRLSRDEPDATLDVRMRRSAPWGAVEVTVLAASGKPVTGLDHVLLHDPESGFLTMSNHGFGPPIRVAVPGAPHVPQAVLSRDESDLPVFRDRADSPVRLAAPNGRHVLQILHRGSLPVTRMVEVVRGSETKVSVTLEPGADLRVVVSGAAGEPVRGFRLALLDGRGTELPYDLRNTRGVWEGLPGTPLPVIPRKNRVIPTRTVEFTDRPPGRYRIVVEKDGFDAAEATVEIEAGVMTSTRLTLR